MFLERELILNLWLAQSRAERGRLEGTEQAGQVALKLLQALPASILTGVHDVSEVFDDDEEEEDLRKLFDSEDLKTFLDEAEEAAKTGAPLGWDVTSKVAYLRYYLTYFAEQKSKESEANLASQWIIRALNLNPLHVDLSVKYADILDLLDQSSEAVSILERIERTPEAPAYVRQWLGCFLLNLEGREDEAIRCSLEYHRQFPDESDTFFNVARAYALKYCHELESNGDAALQQSENRKKALEYLRKALRAQPDYVENFRKRWVLESNKYRDWKCLLQDPDFIQLVGVAPVDSGVR
jgi:tetratricopeptide (TPR) repeat protein